MGEEEEEEKLVLLAFTFLLLLGFNRRFAFLGCALEALEHGRVLQHVGDDKVPASQRIASEESWSGCGWSRSRRAGLIWLPRTKACSSLESWPSRAVAVISRSWQFQSSSASERVPLYCSPVFSSI